ncbi:MFS transporter [Streptomyces sp. A3M-1-3]|uniref:MFS transporter n=1 Tax=Streptomyces sp. A3M-1-3 TaxID=2962044 RepID=UPI0020B66FA8|nr:MFS transporter [Streptomyces sp. A3M-1-3]MCP3820231.1 MFS transporter [Streptomyces sp. A3M-1-3]
MQSSPAGTLRRSHRGVVATFALVGVVNGILAARLPGLAAKLGLDTGDVGLVILSWGVAATVTMQCMRWIVATLGNRLLLRVGTPLVTVAVGLIALSSSFPLLLAAAAGFGVASGIAEAMMNAQGSLVERRTGRPLMNGFHAGWSAGAVAGGLLAVLLAALDVSYTASVLGVAVVAFPLALAVGRTYLDEPVEAEEPTHRRNLPGIVYLIGAVAFLALLLEGLVADWSGLLLARDLHTTEAVAAIAYPVYELATFSGRLFGDRLRLRYGSRSLLAAAGTTTALGVLLVVIAPSAVWAIAGFGLTGLAVCIVVPLCMSLAGALAPGRADAAVAQVSAIGYAGLLIGPVLIGFVAEATSLRTGIATAIAAALLITAAASQMPQRLPAEAEFGPEAAAGTAAGVGHDGSQAPGRS